mmetsp:Transcript_25178/g.39003  ORF Transcript_25178/g.39003 Transcript_25178/m.39003 type:complete len:160 (+) Transcript_25178:1555-2034(+)
MVVILSLSFFIGIAWYLLDSFYLREADDSFVQNFELEGEGEGRVIVTLTYFMFTSFSTVGLGDLHPCNSEERLVGVVLLMFGVTVTSMVTDNLSLMLKQIQTFNRSFEDSVKLGLFMGTLKRFNQNKALPQKMVMKIESYFRYRWEHNQNQIVTSSQED